MAQKKGQFYKLLFGSDFRDGSKIAAKMAAAMLAERGGGRLPPTGNQPRGAFTMKLSLRHLSCAMLFASMIFAGSARAGSVGLNFDPLDPSYYDFGNFALAPTDSAGVVAQTNWNNLEVPTYTPTGTYSNLVDNSGAVVSGLSLSYSNVNNAFIGSDGNSTPDQTLFHGIIEGLYPAGTTGPTIDVSGIDYAHYEVIVYMAEFADSPAAINLGSTTYYYTATNDFPAVGFVQATSTSDSDYPVADYAVFSDLSNSSFEINFTNEGDNRAAIAGLQIVETSVPDGGATSLMLGAALIGVAGLGARRRKLIAA
ncbi:MAG TPA: hypothetical protein VFE31_05450 [Opitutaceae bacterium]|nr:hypothetical protein [Opitutaceae bacterium]